MNPKLSLFEETNIRKTYKNNKYHAESEYTRGGSGFRVG